MLPELGQLCLLLALCAALVQGVFGIAGAQRGEASWMAVVRPAAVAQFVCLALAFLALEGALLGNDFSVRYVAENSNTAMPLIYKLAAAWGAHEGSMLLWICILAVWGLAVALFSRPLPAAFAARVLGVIGLIGVGFLAYLILVSNPFLRQFPAPAQGQDLNPILQDPAMAGHPPMLYMGYVGLSVAFAFAIAALLSGRMDATWARWTRPWTLLAWLFLTVGITLGSWWSYYELGWGGWWAWDPVENASFMPWLVATALLHSLAVTEKRAAFKSWTALLAIAGFSLSLLGTFLVRSGILVSVHSFASDPRRGVFVLALLGTVIGAALLLYAARARSLRDAAAGFHLCSRETLLLTNNVLLVGAAAAVLLGTLYPLIVDSLGLGQISVGAPYFNAVFIPLMVPLLLLIGVGPYVHWKSDRLARALRRLRWPAAAVLLAVLAIAGLRLGGGLALLAGLGLGLWAALSALYEPLQRLRQRLRVPRGMLAMSAAHLGLGLTVLGIAGSSLLSHALDASIAPGQTVRLDGYSFSLRALQSVRGPDYQAVQAELVVRRGERVVALMHPQKRTYDNQDSPATEAAIDARLSRDLYVALGEPLQSDRPVEQSSWSIRLQVKPLVRLIWLGGLCMALGALLAVTDRRYRLARAALPAPAPAPAMLQERAAMAAEGVS
ncbi:MAG TPA: heme lyase CcmF/NrfE family subunit [Steroidobacteraceae bacterium]|nr:heme lyase CcmF/NrfE family subunit [Steroidobacteraceae bacterium]